MLVTKVILILLFLHSDINSYALLVSINSSITQKSETPIGSKHAFHATT
jgi:hypothetical protein